MSSSSPAIAIAIAISASTSLSSSRNLFFRSSFASNPTQLTPKFSLTTIPQNPSFSTSSRTTLFPHFAGPFGGVRVADSVQEESETEGEEESDEFDEDGEGNEPESVEGGRLYVGNLPYAMTSSQLSEVFGEAGNVVSAEIVYDRVTDRSRGFAFVTMASVQEAKEAIQMFDGSQVGGRNVRVNFPEVPRGGEREVMARKMQSSYQGYKDSPYKIYVGNLSWIVTSQMLKEAFADQPGVLSAIVIYERHSGRSRGFGFVTFGSPEEAQAALDAKNGVEVEGRPLRLSLAQGSAPTSSPSEVEEKDLDTSEILSSFST